MGLPNGKYLSSRVFRAGGYKNLSVTRGLFLRTTKTCFRVFWFSQSQSNKPTHRLTALLGISQPAVIAKKLLNGCLIAEVLRTPGTKLENSEASSISY